jgi:uncharacterized SAM-binding protein YcdF (DUF218 family)
VKLAAAALFVLALITWAFVSLGSWLQLSQPPQKSDAIVVLGGDPSRAIKAAALYKEGWAPEIWVSRTYREAYFARLDALGIALPKEEQIVKDALVKRGVPAGQVKFYGSDVLSTLEEAQGLRRALGRADAKLLLVTSAVHARRARMVFRRMFADVRVVAADDPAPATRWWTRKLLAEQVVKETTATLYLMLGGQALNHRP